MRATQATWQVATRATAINGGRTTTALLVTALALSSLAPAGSKAVHGHDHMITHQGIIMALHGIIDHLDLVEMLDDRKLAATALEAHLKTAAAQGVWQVGAPVSRTPDPLVEVKAASAAPGGPAAAVRGDAEMVARPNLRTEPARGPNDDRGGGVGGGVGGGDGRRRAAAVGPDTLFAMMDLNHDGRLFLSELGGFMWAVVEFHIHELTKAAAQQFREAGGSDAHGGLDFATAIGAASEPSHAVGEAVDPATRHQAFADADADGDARLNSTEYLEFVHPMLCKVVMQRYAATFLERHDLDGDGTVNVTEFLNANMKIKEEGDEKWGVQAFEHRAEETELLREFKADFDTDGDERLDATEIARLLSPLFPTHFIVEAFDLGLAADSSGDHELEPTEVKRNWAAFTSNQMLNYGWWLEKQAGKDLDEMYGRMTNRLVRHGLRHREEL